MDGDGDAGPLRGAGAVLQRGAGAVPLRGAERRYAWGSRTAIPALLGGPVPAEHPLAELWFGAHPADSSVLAPPGRDEVALLAAVRADPEGQLGPGCVRRWGGRLPFLLKVLAAEEPLSLQAHPSAAQARAGHAREEALGVPAGDPRRNYPDPHHKPELICALTEFTALAGFRAPAATVELLTVLDAAAPPAGGAARGPLAPYRDLLAGQPDADGMRALFTTWITLPQAGVDALLPPLLDACVGVLRGTAPGSGEGGAEGGGAGGAARWRPECRTLLELAAAHPRDAGVLAAALLERVVLQPGEALYLPAGQLHTYLQGTGVEIMANSDNVLRGGLTSKHVDVPELLRVLEFGADGVAPRSGERVGPHETCWPTPAVEFRLSRLDWDGGAGAPVRLPGALPRVLLCTSGSARVRRGGATVPLPRGGAVWVPAAGGPVAVEPGPGAVQVWCAAAGEG